jgi:hypothetical protein
MEKSGILQKTIETLSPFETANLVEYLRHLSMKSALASPWFLTIFFITAFYAIVVRSKFVLSALFTALTLMVLVRYTMPTEGETLALSSTLPFAFGGLAIGGVLIYLYFIKTE